MAYHILQKKTEKLRCLVRDCLPVEPPKVLYDKQRVGQKCLARALNMEENSQL